MKKKKVMEALSSPEKTLAVEVALAQVIQAEKEAEHLIRETHRQVMREILPEAERKAAQYREEFINEVKKEIDQQRQMLLEEAREKAAEIEQQTAREAEELKRQAETNWSQAVAIVTQEIMRIIKERS